MTPMPAIKATVVNLGSDPSPQGTGSDPNFTGRTTDLFPHPAGCHAGLDPVSIQRNRYDFGSFLRKQYKGYRLFSCSSSVACASGRGRLALTTREVSA